MKKQPKRKYRPVDANSWAVAIARQWVIDPRIVAKTTLQVRSAYERLRGGHGSDDDFDQVAAAMNLGLMRAERIDKQLEAVFVAGVQALLECDRGQGRYVLSGPGIAALNEALDLYLEEVLPKSTAAQMQQAMEDERERAKLHGC